MILGEGGGELSRLFCSRENARANTRYGMPRSGWLEGREEKTPKRKGGGEDRRVILENVRERKGTRRGSRMRMV